MDQSIEAKYVRLGRKFVHGRRVHPLLAYEEAQSVVARLVPDMAGYSRALLRRALASESLIGVMVRPEEEGVALLLAECGILRVEERPEGDAAVYHWRPYRARIADGRRDEVRQALGRLDPEDARRALIAAIAGVEELAEESNLLAMMPLGSGLRVPNGSATDTSVWSVHDSALRAAAGWWRARQVSIPVSARELAATTLGWSKAWTPARIAAFERVIKMKFDDAVDTMEPEVRLRGPLRWTSGAVVVDAHIANPWVGIPARSAQKFGTLDHSRSEGVLVIENLDTFEAICRHSDVPDAWLCVWGSGYVNNSLVGLVKNINKSTAYWGDLDAHGIQIVGDLQRKSGLVIHPVFMDADLHSESAFFQQDEKQTKLAADLASSGHPQLRLLAARVAATRLGREQETMHYLIPKLLGRLAQIPA